MRLTRLLSQIAPVESFAQHGLDDGLAADVQCLSLTIQFLEHRPGQIYIDPLYGWSDDRELIRKMR